MEHMERLWKCWLLWTSLLALYTIQIFLSWWKCLKYRKYVSQYQPQQQSCFCRAPGGGHCSWHKSQVLCTTRCHHCWSSVLMFCSAFPLLTLHSSCLLVLLIIFLIYIFTIWILLMYISHNLRLTLLKCLIQWFLVYSQRGEIKAIT